MYSGSVAVKGTFLIELLLAAAPGRQDLWFDDGSNEEQLVLRGSISEDAWRCSNCDTLLIPSQFEVNINDREGGPFPDRIDNSIP
jgi:hypothetical protein